MQTDQSKRTQTEASEPNPDSEGRLDHEVSAPRSAVGREWELFVREADGDAEPMRHAGSVTAPTKEVAVEQAERLFGDAVSTLWLCPAEETVRRIRTERSLEER